MKIVWFAGILMGMIVSSSLFANNVKMMSCKDFPIEIRKPIEALDKTFQWNSPDCKIVGTKSLFPKRDENGRVQFKKGLQLSIYQHNQLKFICLPGWLCKRW